MRVRDFGQQVNGLLTLHEPEIQEYLTQGVERAVAGIGQKVIDNACTLAIQKIHAEVKHYLLYGEGGKAIRAAVQQTLAPLTALLGAAGGEETPDDGLAESSDA